MTSPLSSVKHTDTSSIVKIAKVSAPPNAKPSNSPKRKAFAMLDNLVFESVHRNFSKPLESSGALFGGAMWRLLQVETAPPFANGSATTTAGAGKQQGHSEDSVLAELERRVEVYSQALDKTKG